MRDRASRYHGRLAIGLNNVWAKTPVKVNSSKLKFAARPNVACKEPPSAPIKMSGNTTVETIRAGSRRNFNKPLYEIAMTALTSFNEPFPCDDRPHLYGRDRHLRKKKIPS